MGYLLAYAGRAFGDADDGADFLRHVRESHRIDPSEDDGETWILHDALHMGGRPPDNSLLIVVDNEIGSVG